MKRWRTLLLACGGIGLLAFVAVQIWARTAPRPGEIGVRDGTLAPCPGSPNCVRSEEGGLEPLTYAGSRDDAHERLLALLRSSPRATIVVQEPEYIAVEFRSAVFGFVDDAEFLFDPAAPVIHFRSASRLGYSDLGVNRERLDSIRRRFEAPSARP